MCQYIKDNGEQCGIDSHDGPFCHQHDDSRYAELWRLIDHLSVSDRGTRFGTMETTCDNCDGPLRRTERLTEHPNRPRHVVFEAVVECDCNEHVLGSTSVRKQRLPDAWSV
jgi:hypothetical protein